MNWDTTKHPVNSNFESGLLTIEGIKRTSILFSGGSRDCYSIKIKENVTYWERTGSALGITTKKEIITFRRTYKQRNQLSDEANDAFYYFAHCYRKRSGTKVPFKGYWFSEDHASTVFCLDEAVNGIIKEEKKRWDKAGLTEEDLKIENIEFVDAKWKALEEDIDGKNWNPSLNEEEKKLIGETRTMEGVDQIQRTIALLRKQKEKDSTQKNSISELNTKLNNLIIENSGLISDIKNREERIKGLENETKGLQKKNDKATLVQQNQANIDDLKAQICALQQQNKNQQKEISSLGQMLNGGAPETNAQIGQFLPPKGNN